MISYYDLVNIIISLIKYARSMDGHQCISCKKYARKIGGYEKTIANAKEIVSYIGVLKTVVPMGSYICKNCQLHLSFHYKHSCIDGSISTTYTRSYS